MKKKVKVTMDEDQAKIVVEAIGAAFKDVDAVESELQRPPPGMSYRQRPRLRGEIRSLMYAIDGATAAPTTSQLGRVKELQAETRMREKEVEMLLNTRIAEINEKVGTLPQLSVRPAKP